MPDAYDALPFDEQIKRIMRSVRSGMIYRGLQAKHDVYVAPVRIPHSVIEHRMQLATEILTRNAFEDNAGKVMFASCKPDREPLPECCMYLFHPDRGKILVTAYKKEKGAWKIFHMRRHKQRVRKQK